MAKVIVVTSGKGGVGKTTTSAAISSGLAMRGKTVVIDFDIGLRNLDIIMNCERRVVYDFVNVINGEANLRQALIKDKRVDNLHILPASQTRDKDALTREGVAKVLEDLAQDGFEYIICDSPAGIEHGALMALWAFADMAIVVANPEVSSVRDSDRILGILQSKSKRSEDGLSVDECLLLTRYNPERVARGEMLGVTDVKEILATRLLGVIPESEAVLKASNQGIPVIHDTESKAGAAYSDAVARLLGEDVPLRFVDQESKGIFKRLFGEVLMSFFDYFRSSKKDSASIAKERLQIIVAHERSRRNQPDYLPKMQHELLAVIRKYVEIDQDQIEVQVDTNGQCSVLELNITLPDSKDGGH